MQWHGCLCDPFLLHGTIPHGSNHSRSAGWVPMPDVRVSLFLPRIRMHHAPSVSCRLFHPSCTTYVVWIHHGPSGHDVARLGAVARAFHPLLRRSCCSVHLLDHRRIHGTLSFRSTSSFLPGTARCRPPSTGWRVQSTMDPHLCKSHPNVRLCRVVLPDDGRPLQLQACLSRVIVSIASEGVAHVHVQMRRCARSNRIESRNVLEGTRAPREKKLTQERWRHTPDGTDTPSVGRRANLGV